MKRAQEIFRALFCIAGLAFGENCLAAPLLTEADAAAPLGIHAGGTLDLRLSENPSTGYVWSVEFDPPDAAAIIADHWTATSDRIGAPGTRDFSIKIKQTGDLLIRAKIWRAWEGEASVTKRLEFRVEAR